MFPSYKLSRALCILRGGSTRSATASDASGLHSHSLVHSVIEKTSSSFWSDGYVKANMGLFGLLLFQSNSSSALGSTALGSYWSSQTGIHQRVLWLMFFIFIAAMSLRLCVLKLSLQIQVSLVILFFPQDNESALLLSHISMKQFNVFLNFFFN